MPKPLRIILHCFQALFLLFGFLVFIAIAYRFLTWDDSFAWTADYELAAIVVPSSVLLSLALSPARWTLTRAAAPAPAAPVYQQHPPQRFAQPPYSG